MRSDRQVWGDMWTLCCLVVALRSSGRHLASGAGGSGFESWFCQVDVESLGKVLYMHFPIRLLGAIKATYRETR